MVSNENKLISFPIKRWNQMTSEQLQRVKEIQCGNYDGRILMQLDIFLYLAGLKYADDGAEVIRHVVEEAEENEQGVYESINTLDAFINGDVVVLEPADENEDERRKRKDENERRKRKDEDGKAKERYIMNLDMLQAYVVHCTEFLEKDHSLISLPFESLTIGKHEYKMPDGFLINTTYQQYTNAQHYLEAYWKVMSAIEKELESTGDNPDFVPSKEFVSKIETMGKQADELQQGFLANMLTPYVNHGEQRYDDKGEPYTFIRKVAKFVAEDEDIAKEDMKDAPKWLFPLVYQQLQDNLRQFKSKFPDLFRESEADPKHDALVAELGTINIIIEKGGYASASAVYDENVVFIFKRLDMMQEEAREMKAAMNKGKQGKK